MKTIHIERLDLKCRGVSRAAAQAALGGLASALRRQLDQSGAGVAQAASGGIRGAGRASPASLADTIAARVARIIHARAPQAAAQRKP